MDLRAIIELGKAQADPLAMGLLMAMRMGGMDLSDSEASRKMLEYARPAIITISTTADGVRFTMVSLKPQSE